MPKIMEQGRAAAEASYSLNPFQGNVTRKTIAMNTGSPRPEVAQPVTSAGSVGSSTASPAVASTKADDFKLERYKFIQQQLNLLNESFHKHINLYQALATAVFTGTATLFVTWKELKITADAAVTGVRALEGLLVLISAFLVLTGIAHLFSWFDYRREEVNLLDQTVGVGFRKLPEWKNFWRWNETWLLVFVILAAVVAIWFAEYRLVPLIH